MKGGDYVKSREGMNIVSEAIAILQYEEFLRSDCFLENRSDIIQGDTHDNLQEVREVLYCKARNEEFVEAWEKSKAPSKKLNESFKKFLSSCESNQNFRYWNNFQQELYPVLHDFELSVRKGDWVLFMSSVERSLHLFFGGSRPNYSRYGSIFYEDALDLQRKFPMLHKHYLAGGFVCYLSDKCTSGIGIDQALEKCYNFTAKAVGGIIGTTRQKSVALWDLMKHDKDLFVSFIKDSVAGGKDSDLGELNSLHHEFSARKAVESSNRVASLVQYIKSVKSPFGSSDKLINIVTKEEVDNTEYYLNFVSFGKELHDKFVYERFAEKSVSLYATISCKYSSTDPYTETRKKKTVKPLSSDESENGKAVKYIQYATSRGKTIEYMLQFPICSRPVFLIVVENNKMFLKTSKKSQLASLLIGNLQNCDVIVSDDSIRCPTVKSDAIIIDFMAVNLITERVEGYIIDQLPAGHSLTGCDTVAKVGTKLSLMKTLETDEDLLTYFGKERLDNDMMVDAEHFLARVISKKYDSGLSFNELRVKLYHQAQEKKLIELPCSSDAIQQNIRRAYMQTRLWLDAPFFNASDWLDPCDYGYTSYPERNSLEPCLFSGLQRPNDVPEPCINCKTCTKKTCPCRVANVACSDFCGCAEHECKNPCL